MRNNADNDKKGASPMQTVTIEEARDHLTELIHRLPHGAEVVITENDGMREGECLIMCCPIGVEHG
jgi:hypothetical protein